MDVPSLGFLRRQRKKEMGVSGLKSKMRETELLGQLYIRTLATDTYVVANFMANLPQTTVTSQIGDKISDGNKLLLLISYSKIIASLRSFLICYGGIRCR